MAWDINLASMSSAALMWSSLQEIAAVGHHPLTPFRRAGQFRTLAWTFDHAGLDCRALARRLFRCPTDPIRRRVANEGRKIIAPDCRSVYRVLAAWISLSGAALWLRWPRWRCRNRCPETSSGLNATVGTEKPIPEKIDHREIAVPIAVVDEMELLLSPEPGKAAKPWSRNMILVVETIMPAEWQRHYRKLNHEQVQSQEQIAQSDNQGDWHKKEQRIIIPVIEIMSGNYVISRIMDVVKLDMVFEKSSAKATVAEISMK
jgi:hypothetical protein